MRFRHLLLVAVAVVCMPEDLLAQPLRQIPGTRPYLPGIPIMPPNVPNSRVRPAASQVGLESTDFYPKNGYPKVLGDAIEQGNAQSTGAGGVGGIGGGIGGGVQGVQAAGSGGFQGNTGNQIGNQGGGTIFGGLFGGNNTISGGGGNNNLGLNPPMDPIRANAGFTGGGFSGVTPKGFGFGGTPEFSKSWTAPLHGVSK